MMDLDSYFKGTDNLENREQVLFDIIDKLDKESFNLFSEVLSLHKNSFYKLDNLVKRTEDLYLTCLSIYGEDKLNLIKNTLENCSGLLEGKIKKKDELYNNESILTANIFIFNYINGTTNDEDVKLLSTESKNSIIEILGRDLNVKSNDIYELLDLSKKQYKSSELKLIKDNGFYLK